MSTPRWAARLAVACCTAAVAGAAIASTATADTFPEPRHERSWALDDGGHATIGAQDEQITRVQPLTTNGTTKEFFADLEAFGQLSAPRGAPVAGTLTAGFQIACMASYSGTSLGFTITPEIGIGGAVGTSPGVDGTGGISAAPAVNVWTGPGRVVTVQFGKQTLSTTLGMLRVREAHLHVDGCIGPTTARSYAALDVTTEAGTSTNEVYGQVFPL